MKDLGEGAGCLFFLLAWALGIFLFYHGAEVADAIVKVIR